MTTITTHRSSVVALITAALLTLDSGCAKEDPEARMPGAYDRQLDKAKNVEQSLDKSLHERMQTVDEKD